MLYVFLRGMFGFLFKSQPSPLGLLLPGIETPGLPTISFLHWIIAIFVLAIVHEFSHGVLARVNNIKVKSSGFAALGIVLPLFPAAFVEPDEKQMSKKSVKAQLSVLAGGSFANFVTAFLVILPILYFMLNPISESILEPRGINITLVQESYPAANSGIKPGEIILMVNDKNVGNVKEFLGEMKKVSPDETIIITTNEGKHLIKTVENPNDKTMGYIGINIAPTKLAFNEGLVNAYGENSLRLFLWIQLLFNWLLLTNVVVGLFNLLPIGPLDGGRMFFVALNYLIRDEIKSKKIWGFISLILLAMILFALSGQIFGFISKLFV
ncbi:site-2 protease family protein [Candidatus Woesearchaeota archaeon]|nr:site-2 protease family protein [Candidatus Woesearchaeota archaeon]